MEPECKDIVSVLLPAVRASVASSLMKRHGYTQARAAKKLGIVQVAVSKYVNGKHSKEIARMRKYIEANGMQDAIVKRITERAGRAEIDRSIDETCERLVAYNHA